MKDYLNRRNQRKTLMKFISLLVIFFLTTGLWSDERFEPIDIIIALDTSRSMAEEIEAAKEYIIHQIITDRLIMNDYLLVIGFHRDTEVITTGIMSSEHDKKRLKRNISEVKANGFGTDIGNMFDRLQAEFEKRMNNNRRKLFFIITDNIHDPQPDSPYYSRDGNLEHEYLERIDTLLVYPGWKVLVLVI